MIKVKKNNNPKLNQVFALELADKKHWTIAHLCYIAENNGFYALTFGFFNYLEDSLLQVNAKINKYDLSNPVIVATINVDPLKTWQLLQEKQVIYKKLDVASRITGTWGWFDKTEMGIYAILETYFDIYPWDLLQGKASIENILLTKDRRSPPRYLKDFTLEEVKALGLYKTIEYAQRLGELKK